jgi:GNAT superfamily N-acetyltransferase
MAGKIMIKRISGRRALSRFVRFPFSLYRNCPLWVPPMISDELSGIDAEKNPVFGFTDAGYWLAEREGKAVGRVAGFVNRRDNERRGKQTVRFGMIDFVDEPAVCTALLDTVERWAEEQGMDLLEGPLGPGHFDRNCVLIEGFDELPTAISSYNFPYYAAHIESCGYRKETDYLEHRVAISAEPDPKVERISTYVLKKKGLSLWQAASKRQLLSRGREFFQLINTAYADLHDFVALSDDEIGFLIKQFFTYIDRRYIKVVEDQSGAMVAVGVAMESFSVALQSARGKLWPFGWWRMMQAMKGNDVLDLCLVAVRPDLQGSGLNAIVMHEMHKVAVKRGLKWAETNGELETNTKILSMWKGYDHRTHKRRRIYSKRLHDRPSRPVNR